MLAVLCRPLLDRDLFTEPASIREIAADLVVSEAAVKQHLANLYLKFDVGEGSTHRRSRLANEALRRGAVSLADLRRGHERSSPIADLLLVGIHPSELVADVGVGGVEVGAILRGALPDRGSEVVPVALRGVALPAVFHAARSTTSSLMTAGAASVSVARFRQLVEHRLDRGRFAAGDRLAGLFVKATTSSQYVPAPRPRTRCQPAGAAARHRPRSRR